MSIFKDFSNYQYKAIEEDAILPGDVFVCQTIDIYDPFSDWNYAVGRKREHGVSVFGKFKDVEHARIFARTI